MDPSTSPGDGLGSRLRPPTAATRPATTSLRRHRSTRMRRWRRALTPAGFIAPAVIVMLAILGYPVVDAFVTSLHHEVITEPNATAFVGLDNFRNLAADPAVHQAVWHTIIWAGGNLVLQLGLGMAIALLLHQRIRGRGLIRTFVVVPWIVPTVIVALVWRFLLDPTTGPLNRFLVDSGITDTPPIWLADTTTALPVLILISVWKWTPFVAIILLAGLQSVPNHLHDAGRVDGASGIQRFRFIVLPHIRTNIALASLLTLAFSINNFAGIWLFTRGGPASATETITTLSYRVAFSRFDFGSAAAIAVGLFLVLLAISLTYFYVVEGDHE